MRWLPAQAYEDAGIGPQDLYCVELHDASAPSEIAAYEYLGLCAPGEGVQLIESRATALGGRIPVNASGGLLRKGHPVGATGCAQIVELTEQLRGRPASVRWKVRASLWPTTAAAPSVPMQPPPWSRC